MNSSVTMLSETSVISILWREMSWSRRSKGPSKLSRWTLKGELSIVTIEPSLGSTAVTSAGLVSISTCEPYFFTCSNLRMERRVAPTERGFSLER